MSPKTQGQPLFIPGVKRSAYCHSSKRPRMGRYIHIAPQLPEHAKTWRYHSNIGDFLPFFAALSALFNDLRTRRRPARIILWNL